MTNLNDSGNQPLPDTEVLSEDREDDEDRPELSIAPKDRKLSTQPFDFIVGSLESQIKDEQLLLQDDYQRRQVWDDGKASRLIESLLLNVPIPVCYFAELEDGAYSVIDGQQRLTSIWRFLTNTLELKGLRVRPELNRKRFAELDRADQRLIKTRTIRCIVLQKESNPEIRFDVFERLNSGSVKLNPQELRNSTFRGTLNTLIKNLCGDKDFQFVRRASEIDARMKDAEMILRFFSFHYDRTSYQGYFAPFLDTYLQKGSKFGQQEIEKHKMVFLETIRKVKMVFGNNAFRQVDEYGKFANQINRAVFDVIVLTFPYISIEDLERNTQKIINALQLLCTQSGDFQDAIGKATRDKHRINTRVRLWREELTKLGLICPELKYGS